MIKNQLKQLIVKKPTVILVDDHHIFRKSLISLLTIENLATVIGEACNGIELLELLSDHTPDLILMDIDMPEMNGFETTQRVLEMMPQVKIIVLTMFEDFDYFQKMIELGAVGFLLKSSDINDFEKAIHQVMKGNKFFSISQTNKKSIINQQKKIQKDKDNNKNRDKTNPGIPWF